MAATQCKICGESIAPARRVERLAEELEIDAERLHICPKCRRNKYAEVLRELEAS
ncbi:MAG: hypothetical protein KAW89_04125 [Armatimonadetes bacterium]|nr:hypothetical protein [Armatimonadota bacterium]